MEASAVRHHVESGSVKVRICFCVFNFRELILSIIS